MERSAFQRWMGRIGLTAMLLLVLVPTTARVVHASAGAGATVVHPHGDVHAAHAAHTSHAAPAQRGGRDGGDSRPAIGDPDCDYCPLLASMVEAARLAFDAGHVPPAVAPAPAPQAPRLRRLHPNGLGSRGPPLPG